MSTRFAWLGRLSTDDRQDESLARPSQFEACEAKIAARGTIVAEFWDQMTGARTDRPALSALLYEARDKTTRRFDEVVIFNTSRLSRDRADAAMLERDLRRLGVPIVYVHGGDSKMERGMNQLMDEQMREVLKVETRRGQEQSIKQGWWGGGRPAFGYKLERLPHPVAVRAARGETKSKITIEAEQAVVVMRIFRWWVDGLGMLAIADRLNAEKVPSPTHTNPRRNVKNRWSAATIRHILTNPCYVGTRIWDRTDHSIKREKGGGGARRRDRSEWLVIEDAHAALVSRELFDAAQARLTTRKSPTGISRKGQRVYLLSGFVRCASGHQPLSMFGRSRFDYRYMACNYGKNYGASAAAEIEHPQWLNVREDRLEQLIFQFLDERLFGEARMDLLAKQFDRRKRKQPSEAVQVRKRIKDLDQAIGRQVIAIEQGVEPVLVSHRIAELRKEKEQAESDLRAQAPETADDGSELAAALQAVPDLSQKLRSAPLDAKRRFFQAIDLQVVYDRIASRVQITADVDPDLIRALGGGDSFATECDGGGRIRTFEGRANAFTARPL